MWHLKMTNDTDDWVTVGSFENVTAAAQRIIEASERYPVSAIFFGLLTGTKTGNEQEAFPLLEYTGRKRRYVVKRVQH